MNDYGWHDQIWQKVNYIVNEWIPRNTGYTPTKPISISLHKGCFSWQPSSSIDSNEYLGCLSACHDIVPWTKSRYHQRRVRVPRACAVPEDRMQQGSGRPKTARPRAEYRKCREWWEVIVIMTTWCRNLGYCRSECHVIHGIDCPSEPHESSNWSVFRKFAIAVRLYCRFCHRPTISTPLFSNTIFFIFSFVLSNGEEVRDQWQPEVVIMAMRMNRVPSEQTRARSVSFEWHLMIERAPSERTEWPHEIVKISSRTRIPPGNWRKDGNPGYARAARRN